MGQAKRRREAGDRISHCRTCTYCCSLPRIEALDKPAYRPCTHIAGGGCSIFGQPERPATCLAYACAYLTARMTEAPERNRIPHPLDCGAYFHRDPVEKVIFLFVDPARPLYWKTSALLVDFLQMQVGAAKCSSATSRPAARGWPATWSRSPIATAARSTSRASARPRRRLPLKYHRLCGVLYPALNDPAAV